MIRRVCFFILFMSVFTTLLTIDKFYNYYNNGLDYMEKGDWLRAIEQFQGATSIEYSDTRRKRTYGSHYIKYYPHREIGIAFYNLGDYEKATEELELSIAFKKSKRAQEYLEKISSKSGYVSKTFDFEEEKRKQQEKERLEKEEEEKRLAEEKRLKEIKEEKERLAKQKEEKERLAKLKAEEERLEKERLKREEEKRKQKEKELLAKQKQEEKKVYENPSTHETYTVPPGALTYDINAIPQVGERLSIAVLQFEEQGEANKVGSGMTEKMITELLNLRRFKVIERTNLNKIMEEQKLGLTGFVDDNTAVEVGKIAGADVVIVSTIKISDGYAKVYSRGIDTATSELIVAKEAESNSSDLRTLESLVKSVAIKIYNALPLVQGFIADVTEDQVILTIGSDVMVRKGSSCVIYKEGKKVYHPVTGKLLNTQKILLGDAIVIQSQDGMSTAKLLNTSGKISIGDKVLTK